MDQENSRRHCLHDADAFFAAGPGGYQIGRLDDEPVGPISAVRSNLSFIGFDIVQPAFRGEGFGLAIWNAAISQLKRRTVGLDGVVDQKANYRAGLSVLHTSDCQLFLLDRQFRACVEKR